MRRENGVNTCYVNVPSNDHPLLRFYSLYPNNDIPWVNTMLVKRAFILDNQIEWDESMSIYQDIQFNIGLLVRQPLFKWIESEYDSYWVYNDTVENIGMKVTDNMSKMTKLIEVYKKYLGVNKIDHVLKRKLNRQFASAVIAISIELAYLKEKDYRKYLGFIRSQTRISWLEYKLLETLGVLYKIDQKRNYHWLFIRTITSHLKWKRQPIIKKGSFLKIRELVPST